MEEKYVRYSEITGRTYDVFKCVKILNIEQAVFYLQHKVKLMDLQISTNKQGKPIFVFVFNKDDSYETYKLWCQNRRGDDD